MNSKKVGVALLIISIILLLIFIISFQSLAQQSQKLGCFDNAMDCQPLQQSFSITHLGFGVFGFVLALSIYLLMFSKSDQVILSHLQQKKQELSSDEKLKYLLMGLDEFEKQTLIAIRKQEGITQNTLRLRVDMSKAKLSQTLSSLEKKQIVTRSPKGKTLAIFSKLEF